jgi:predicted RNase H-like nuclease (RuvC/YqgF family)
MEVRFDDKTIKELISLYDKKKIGLEGNIIKLIKTDNQEFADYLKACIDKDNDSRRKRLDITKRVQAQNTELTKWREENERITDELNVALKQAEEAKNNAENDLDILQKKTQFELIGVIVKVSLYIIIGVGIITSIMYGISILSGSRESHDIGDTWSNMFGILLTNAFSIIGTIMGVKYASEKINK